MSMKLSNEDFTQLSFLWRPSTTACRQRKLRIESTVVPTVSLHSSKRCHHRNWSRSAGFQALLKRLIGLRSTVRGSRFLLDCSRHHHCQAQQPQINISYPLLKTRSRLSTKFGGLKLPIEMVRNNTVNSVFIAAESCRWRLNACKLQVFLGTGLFWIWTLSVP